jgi:hypothetical protein
VEQERDAAQSRLIRLEAPRRAVEVRGGRRVVAETRRVEAQPAQLATQVGLVLLHDLRRLRASNIAWETRPPTSVDSKSLCTSCDKRSASPARHP